LRKNQAAQFVQVLAPLSAARLVDREDQPVQFDVVTLLPGQHAVHTAQFGM
jgi:hypothetical protein